MTYKIAPSILSADFSRLGEQVKEVKAAGGDWLHVDVMDGHFAPNITIGPLVVQAISPLVSIPIDVHLMIENPELYLANFARAGADHITVHIEACTHIHRVVHEIKALGLKAGVALNPATPLSTLEEILPYLDLIVLMSVNPGFGGQKYIPGTTSKIARLKHKLNAIASRADIMVDGGIHAGTIAEAANAGATVLVAGSAIFNRQGTIADNVALLRDKLRLLGGTLV